MGIVFLCCKVSKIVKVGSSTLIAELSFWHAIYLARVIRVADIIRVTWLVYLACLRSYVLRACSNFDSKHAISITLFERRPNSNTV